MKVPKKLKSHWAKIPKFYKNLGVEACYAYVRRKASGLSINRGLIIKMVLVPGSLVVRDMHGLKAYYHGDVMEKEK
jgi:hypothetical protein